MSDKELLELAAKAAGLVVVDRTRPISLYIQSDGCHGGALWNPLADDGDCARLEAAVGIDVAWHRMGVVATYRDTEDHEIFGHDVVVREPYADHQDRNDARRRASTELAAQVGKAMQ